MNDSQHREDKRVRRTRQALAAALIALTLERGYETITIQDITTRADVGYRTYFRHYRDKDALLYDVLQTTIAEMRQLMGNPSGERQTQEGPHLQFLTAANGRLLFEHIQEQHELYRVLLNSGPVALEPILTFGRRETTTALGPAPISSVPADIVANYLVGTTIDLVRWWLDNDMPYSPEEMGRYLAVLAALPRDATSPA